jgi:hypothetical protein
MKKTLVQALKIPRVKKLAALLTVGLACNYTMAQNQPQLQIWTTPPTAVHFQGLNFPSPIQALSLPQHAGGYLGGTTANPSNCAYDANGNLLFFVVDGTIYDKAGNYLGNVFGASLPMTPELVIMPVPGHCMQFYIVGAIIKEVLPLTAQEVTRKPHM